MEHLVPGFVFVQFDQATLRILLVRPAGPSSPWVMPQALREEGAQEFFSALRQDLFCPKARFEPILSMIRWQANETVKALAVVGVDRPIQLVRVLHGGINPQFDSERYADARWASFEEAFHISSGHDEAVLRWAERLSKKISRNLAPTGMPMDLPEATLSPNQPYLPAAAVA